MSLLAPCPWKFALVVFLLAASCTQANDEDQDLLASASSSSYKSVSSLKTITRHKRALGFFQKIGKMGKIIYQQYNDTTWTLKNIYDILSNEFTDTYTTTTPDPRLPTTTPDPSTSTTAKYRITRAELGRILNRNYRGLQKLFRLEWNDAWNQTKYNVAIYKKELENSVYGPGNITIAGNSTALKP
ncbi:uncharacterized protein LOC129718303 [Wyeomyia smithii]|uniref:uncharacterized protein LOC129718303 n=1 Tax=Wyeomyia smithii TaxID=174621 RepID=UPI002467E6E0|nr:uncharacterized protein LOC129718303 [Wyeomyia smithii]XP_055524921.1 uncharacterized protein LOC129718303 [Wyeomyia smithii]XP_055524922.1 uncharacterized protein LOC129718303 [Wyeomyia smithii]XP_055524924.1 uncharacterized protein LOC129718303 [Wyeomyia smithii]